MHSHTPRYAHSYNCRKSCGERTKHTFHCRAALCQQLQQGGSIARCQSTCLAWRMLQIQSMTSSIVCAHMVEWLELMPSQSRQHWDGQFNGLIQNTAAHMLQLRILTGKRQWDVNSWGKGIWIPLTIANVLSVGGSKSCAGSHTCTPGGFSPVADL